MLVHRLLRHAACVLDAGVPVSIMQDFKLISLLPAPPCPSPLTSLEDAEIIRKLPAGLAWEGRWWWLMSLGMGVASMGWPPMTDGQALSTALVHVTSQSPR